MSNKKCPTNDQLEKVMTCQNFNAEHLPKIQTAISKLINTTLNVEKDGQSGGSKLVDYKQKIIDNQAEADANTVINRKTEQYKTLVNNISDKLNHLDILNEYTKNLDNLEKYYEKNKNSDEEEIQEIISKNEINNRMAQYYEEQDEKVNTIMHYTKFFYWPVIVSVLCILLWVSYKFGYLTAVGKYIKNNIKKLKNKIVPIERDSLKEEIKRLQIKLRDAKKDGTKEEIENAKTELRKANNHYEKHVKDLIVKQYKPQEAKKLTDEEIQQKKNLVDDRNNMATKGNKKTFEHLTSSIKEKKAKMDELELKQSKTREDDNKIARLKNEIEKEKRLLPPKSPQAIMKTDELSKDDPRMRKPREPRYEGLKVIGVDYAEDKSQDGGAKMNLRSAGILDAIQNKAKDKKTAVSFLQDKIPKDCEALKPEYLKYNMTTTEEQKCRKKIPSGLTNIKKEEIEKILNKCQSENYCSNVYGGGEEESNTHIKHFNPKTKTHPNYRCVNRNSKQYEEYKKCIERSNKDGKDEVKGDASSSSTWEKNIFGNWSKKSTSKTSKDISQGIKQTQKNITSGVTEVKKTAQKVIRSPKFYLGILLSLIIIPSLIVPVGVPIFDFITYYLFPNTSPF